MTGLETHPTLASYRLEELHADRRRRAVATFARQAARPAGRAGRTIRVTPFRIRRTRSA